MDLIAPMPADENNVRIPDGEYRFDLSQSYEEFTIVDIGNTDYSWVDDQMEGWALPLADASLKVSGNRFELVAFVETKEYHVTFEGDYSLTTSVITDHVSSLTKDTVIDVSNCSASVSSYGDYWNCGYNNWSIEFVCNDGMKYGTILHAIVADELNTPVVVATVPVVAVAAHRSRAVRDVDNSIFSKARHMIGDNTCCERVVALECHVILLSLNKGYKLEAVATNLERGISQR